MTSNADIPHLEARWVPSLREALQDFGAILVTDNEFVPRPERNNDLYVMDLANGDEQFTDKDIRIINYCQLYLHITTILEMYDADGNDIMPHVWRCTRAPWFDATINVAIQQRPSDHQIRTRWNKMCKLAQQHRVSGSWIAQPELTQRLAITGTQDHIGNVPQLEWLMRSSG